LAVFSAQNCKHGKAILYCLHLLTHGQLQEDYRG